MIEPRGKKAEGFRAGVLRPLRKAGANGLQASNSIYWESAFLSDAGPMRSVNEDAFLDAPDLGLWVVADGMGGHEAGQLASRMIIDALDQELPSGPRDDVIAAVKNRLCDVNRELREIALARYGGRIIGSTVALLIGYDNLGICLWAGDSRIYRYHGHLTQLTKDHSEVETPVQNGALGRPSARHHPVSHVITRAVGALTELELNSCIEELRDGDVFLLCSDGLNRAITDDEIARTLACGSCADAVRALMQLSIDRQVADNVTVGVVRIGTTTASMLQR